MKIDLRRSVHTETTAGLDRTRSHDSAKFFITTISLSLPSQTQHEHTLKHNMSNTNTPPYNPAYHHTGNDAIYATWIPIEQESPSWSTAPSVVSPINSTIPSTTSPSSGAPPKIIKGPRYVRVGTRKPVQLTYCPHCGQQGVNTHVRTKATETTGALFLGALIVFWPLCWLPFVIDGCKQTNHYCTNCGAKVGRVKPFG